METEEGAAAPKSPPGALARGTGSVKDDPKKMRKNGGFWSGAWSHFLRATDGQSGKCLHCGSLIRTKNGTTTGLHIHLRSMHQINSRQALTERKKHTLVKGAGASGEVDVDSDDDDEEATSHRNGSDVHHQTEETFTLATAQERQTPKSTDKVGSGLLRPKVERQEIVEDDEDEDNDMTLGDALSVQIDDGQNQHYFEPHESYQRVDDQEITLSSLRNKSNRELKDIILHLQYKCQASEIECQRVKTKLALLKLSYCQSKLLSASRDKNGRTNVHTRSRLRPRRHESDDDDIDPDFSPH